MPSSDPDSVLIKKNLRRQLLTQRQSMPGEQWRFLSDHLCQQLLGSSFWQEAQTILAYMTFRQEPDLSWLFRHDSHHQWGLPRCVGQSLVWHRCHPVDGDGLQVGKYGILEPSPGLPELEATAVDLILVPALACDRSGYRLGYGGGYYDRLLASPAWSAVPTIGIIFHQTLWDQLPTDPWDQPLQAICTEQGILEVSLTN